MYNVDWENWTETSSLKKRAAKFWTRSWTCRRCRRDIGRRYWWCEIGRKSASTFLIISTYPLLKAEIQVQYIPIDSIHEIRAERFCKGAIVLQIRSTLLLTSNLDSGRSSNCQRVAWRADGKACSRNFIILWRKHDSVRTMTVSLTISSTPL